VGVSVIERREGQGRIRIKRRMNDEWAVVGERSEVID